MDQNSETQTWLTAKEAAQYLKVKTRSLPLWGRSFGWMTCRDSGLALGENLADVGLVALGVRIRLGKAVVKRFAIRGTDADSEYLCPANSRHDKVVHHWSRRVP